MPKSGIITQARMTSSRLPGKILLRADGKTVLEHHINRSAWSNIPVYVATTTNATDDAIVNLVIEKGIPYFRGDEFDVLERFYRCAEKFGLDIIIRVTSDCPLIDGHFIADGLAQYLKSENNKQLYLSNALERTFPRGLDFEIFSFDLLKDAFLHATTTSDREHVTPYINQNRAGNVTIQHYTHPENHSDLRWTLDTTDDWKLIKILFEDHHVAGLTYSETLKIVQRYPELATLNNHIKQKDISL
jgi:spore coat polysaccharide biosynthesis protein SpsF